MRTRVKFCGLVRPEDVDAAVAIGADAIGFVFFSRSPRCIDVDTARMLRRRLPSYVCAVGLFVNETAENVRRVAGQVGIDLLQFHGDETPAQCAAAAVLDPASGTSRPFWRAVRMGGAGDLLESEALFGEAEAFLLDTLSDGYGGSGKRFDWSWVPELRARPVVLSGGLTAQTVGQGIARVHPMAVDVSSGIQGINPRQKDAEKMELFMAEVIAADARAGSLRSAMNHRANLRPNQQ
jgi:phosphoribosylanthranilate isomerase